eukprot:gene5318-6462_t
MTLKLGSMESFEPKSEDAVPDEEQEAIDEGPDSVTPSEEELVEGEAEVEFPSEPEAEPEAEPLASQTDAADEAEEEAVADSEQAGESDEADKVDAAPMAVSETERRLKKEIEELNAKMVTQAMLLEARLRISETNEKRAQRMLLKIRTGATDLSGDLADDMRSLILKMAADKRKTLYDVSDQLKAINFQDNETDNEMDNEADNSMNDQKDKTLLEIEEKLGREEIPAATHGANEEADSDALASLEAKIRNEVEEEVAALTEKREAESAQQEAEELATMEISELEKEIGALGAAKAADAKAHEDAIEQANFTHQQQQDEIKHLKRRGLVLNTEKVKLNCSVMNAQRQLLQTNHQMEEMKAELERLGSAFEPTIIPENTEPAPLPEPAVDDLLDLSTPGSIFSSAAKSLLNKNNSMEMTQQQIARPLVMSAGWGSKSRLFTCNVSEMQFKAALNGTREVSEDMIIIPIMSEQACWGSIEIHGNPKDIQALLAQGQAQVDPLQTIQSGLTKALSQVEEIELQTKTTGANAAQTWHQGGDNKEPQDTPGEQQDSTGGVADEEGGDTVKYNSVEDCRSLEVKADWDEDQGEIDALNQARKTIEARLASQKMKLAMGELKRNLWRMLVKLDETSNVRVVPTNSTMVTIWKYASRKLSNVSIILRKLVEFDPIEYSQRKFCDDQGNDITE